MMLKTFGANLFTEEKSGQAKRGFFSFTMIMVVCWFLVKVTCTWIVLFIFLSCSFFSMIGLQAESGAVLTNIV